MGWYTHVIHSLPQQIVINAVECLCVVNEHKNHTQALFICLLYQTSYVGYLIVCSMAFLITSLCIRYLLPQIDLHSFFNDVQ